MSSDASKSGGKLWGGRFSTGVNPLMESFGTSIHIDSRLYDEDLTGSAIYAQALAKINIITDQESDCIIKALEGIREEWHSGRFEIIPKVDEDIHTANERRLKELVGAEIGGKLHTGRSRNEQVALDTTLWVGKACDNLCATLRTFLHSLVNRAESEIQIIMPGYTHLQRAQPVLWSHWLLSHAQALKSDLDRLLEIRKRVMAECPLGSGAIAGTPFARLDRQWIAEQLGYNRPTSNSMHTVGNRDYVAEFQFWASLTATHLSKFSEDLLIFSTSEFGFVSISDEYSTGSSLMPQKKNADSLELIRGKSGRLLGNCVGILVMLKGLPSTYSRDMQEDKFALFVTYDTIVAILKVCCGVVSTLKVNQHKCREALSMEMLATDVAYYLVRKGVPFREGHELAGKVVARAENLKTDISRLSLSDLKSISDKFNEDLLEIFDYEKSVAQYEAVGGTSVPSVKAQIENLRKILQELI